MNKFKWKNPNQLLLQRFRPGRLNFEGDERNSMRIVFTRHAAGKFKKFKEDGIVILKKNVLETVKNPYHLDKSSDKPKIIVSKEFNKRLVLRVVYKEEYGIITVITFYLAKRGRYYESN